MRCRARSLLPAIAFLLAGLVLPGSAAEACPGLDPCLMEGGDYYALPPPGWDGRQALPATIFYHGYGMKAADLARDPAFTTPFAAEGVLLILPDSDGPGWGGGGPDARGRDEIAFTDALRADLVQRFPVDRRRLLVAGFSAGAILGLDLACRRAQDFAGFVIIAGAFREPVPEACPSGPVNLLQIQGRSDEAVPLAGTPPDDRFHLAGILPGMAALRRIDGCPEPPDATAPGPSGQSCEAWSRCASGHALSLCLHDGGHLMPAGWVHQAETWLSGLPSLKPGPAALPAAPAPG